MSCLYYKRLRAKCQRPNAKSSPAELPQGSCRSSELDGEGSILVEALAGLLAQQASADHLLHGQSGTILGVGGLLIQGLHDADHDVDAAFCICVRLFCKENI